MPAITTADITLVFLKQTVGEKVRRNLIEMTLGNGTFSYPSGGVPLPSDGSLGMKQSLQDVIVRDEDNNPDIIWRYDTEKKSLRAYKLKELGTSATLHKAIIRIEAVGW